MITKEGKNTFKEEDLYIVDIHPYKLVKTKLSRLMEMLGRHYALGYTLVRYKREVIMYILRYKEYIDSRRPMVYKEYIVSVKAEIAKNIYRSSTGCATERAI